MKIALFIIAFIICAAGSMAIKMESFKIKWYWHDNKLIGLFYITAAIMFLILLIREIKIAMRKKQQKEDNNSIKKKIK